MSSATVSRSYQQQHTRLPNVVHQHAPKKDFTYTFQKVAPVLFVFLLALSIYTKYRMSNVVVPPQTAVQSFTPSPWEKHAPAPHVDVDFGEKKWEELKETLSNKKDNIEEALEDVVDVGQGTLEDLKTYGREKWESIKSVGKEKIEDNWAEMQEQLLANKDAILNKWKDGKAKVQEGIDKVNEMTPTVDDLKTKTEQVQQRAAELGLGAMGATKEWVKENLPAVQDKVEQIQEKAAGLGLGAMDTTKEWVKEKLPAVHEKAEQFMKAASEGIERVFEHGTVVAPVYGPELPPHMRSTMTNQSYVMPW